MATSKSGATFTSSSSSQPASAAATAAAALLNRSSPDLLVLVLDLNPLSWIDLDSHAQKPGGGDEAAAADQLQTLRRALDEVCIFLNAHTALQHENGVVVWAAAMGRAELLYSSFHPDAGLSEDGAAAAAAAAAVATDPGRGTASTSASTPSGIPDDASTFSHFRSLDEKVLRGAVGMLQRLAHTAEEGGELRATTAIVSAIAQALCLINQVAASSDPLLDGGGTHFDADPATSGSGANASAAAASTLRSRILILSATPDTSAQYVPMMNCIFAAQKRNVVIDVCKLAGRDTVFLQQACHLTGGNYFRLAEPKLLLQTLMSAYLPSRSVRPLLNLPTQDEVDFRAACFCHRRIVDVGYICSVCLSIFCTPRSKCTTCRARFPVQTLARLRAEGGRELINRNVPNASAPPTTTTS